MTICDKIQTVGETLESNLNARGVSCTFGTGTGEKNILQMTNLITPSNLKGSADSIISISASRPYLLSGEKTDLIVKLTNGLGQPLANKSVSISDGTSVYSGITNSQGIYTLYNVEVSSDTTFTATYGTVTASCTVEYCIFVDYMITSNNQSDNYSYTTGSYSLSDDGLTIDASTYSSSNYQANLRIDGTNVYTVPYTVEFDLIHDGNDQFRMYFHNTSFSNTAVCSGTIWTSPSGSVTHVKFTVTSNQVTRTINGSTTNLNPSTVASTVGCRFGYWQSTQSAIKIRNYRVKSL